MNEFRKINDVLDKYCQLALRQPLPDNQSVLKTDARFQAAGGYAVLTEDAPNQKFTSARKIHASEAYGSKTFSPSQMKMSIYAQQFLARYLAFNEFLTYVLGNTNASHHHDRQQISHTIFSNQFDPTTIMESKWFCTTN